MNRKTSRQVSKGYSAPRPRETPTSRHIRRSTRLKAGTGTAGDRRIRERRNTAQDNRDGYGGRFTDSQMRQMGLASARVRKTAYQNSSGPRGIPVASNWQFKSKPKKKRTK